MSTPGGTDGRSWRSGCICRAKSGITTPGGDIGRGNILDWEQPLADRLRGTPLVLDARMDPESILYRTLWLFGWTFVAVAITFGFVIWWIRPAGACGEAGRVSENRPVTLQSGRSSSPPRRCARWPTRSSRDRSSTSRRLERSADPRRRRRGGALPIASRAGARAGHRARSVARSPVSRLHPAIVYDDRAGLSRLHSRRRPLSRPRSPTSSPTRPIASRASGRRRRCSSSSRPMRSTGSATGWAFPTPRAVCSRPADRWRRSTRSCAPASGCSASISAAACCTPPIRRTTRC